MKMKPSSPLSISLSLALITALLGCGTSPVRPPADPAALRGAPMAAVGLTDGQAEKVPTPEALVKLGAASPDTLVDHAPLEPGLPESGIWPHPPKEDLGNFGQIEPTLWRGARPTDKGMEQLVGMGLRTIVSLENDKAAVAHEREWAEGHGLVFVSMPLSVVLPPKTATIDRFLALASEPANRPLYFHCMQGRDRTGTAAFCYRITHDTWDYDHAYAEMKTYRFHTYLLGLQAFLVYYSRKHHAE